MLGFLRREPSAAQQAFRRAEALLHIKFEVDKVSESDWLFRRRGRKDSLLLTMWAYREPERERPQKEEPLDGLIWDIAWTHKRAKISEGQLVMARAAAGRGQVEMQESGLIGYEISFFDRMITDVGFEDAEATHFMDECANAAERMRKALAHG